MQSPGLENEFIRNRQDNISEVSIQNFSFSLPIPLMIFSTPLKEILNFNFNPDKINFIYVYADYQKHIPPDIDTKAFLMLNLNSQFILPKDIKFTINYFVIPRKADYYFFQTVKPVGNNIDLTLWKKFMKDRLSVSVFANDILNSQQMSFGSLAAQPNVVLMNKFDSRNFGFRSTTRSQQGTDWRRKRQIC